MHSTSAPRTRRTRQIAAAFALSGLLIVGSPGLAGAKGSGGSKGGKPSASLPATSGTLSAPSTFAAGQVFTVSGTGFSAGSYWMKVQTASSLGYVSVVADANGSFSVQYALWTAGPATFTVGSSSVTVTAS